MKESKQKIRPVTLAALVVMVLLSFANLTGYALAGLSVLVGVAFFFIDKGRGPWAGSGLDEKSIGKDIASLPVWLWILAPSAMNLVCTGLARLVMPGFIEHLLARSAQFLTYGKLPLLAVQLVVAALGEEIAWRAFFQRQLGRLFPVPAAIAVTSVLFAMGHLAGGFSAIVVYDLVFVAINSVLYGIVFHKTGNAWVSAISHLVANASSILLLVFL